MERPQKSAEDIRREKALLSQELAVLRAGNRPPEAASFGAAQEGPEPEAREDMSTEAEAKRPPEGLATPEPLTERQVRIGVGEALRALALFGKRMTRSVRVPERFKGMRMPEVKMPRPHLPELKMPEVMRVLRSKKIFGKTLFEFLAGAGTGFAVRNITRWGLGVLTGGTGFLLSIPSGALAGGAVGWLDAYRKEKQRAETLTHEDLEGEYNRLLSKEKASGKELDRQERLGQYFSLAAGEVVPGLGQDKEELFSELKKEIGIRRTAITRGIVQGAFVGGLGATVGTLLADWIGNYFLGGEEGAKEAAKEMGEEAARAAREAARQASLDAYNKTFEKAMAAGLVSLDERGFLAVAGKGEGTTHLARKWIADYISEHHALGHRFTLEKAQLIFAEDTIRKEILGDRALQVGDRYRVTGKAIREVLGRAESLGQEQVANLDKNWVPKIGAKTWKEALDYSRVFNEQNDFAPAIIEQAKRDATRAAERAAAAALRQAAQEATGLVKSPSQSSIKASEAWLSERAQKYLAAGTLGAMAGGAVFIFRGQLGKIGRGGIELAAGMGRGVRRGGRIMKRGGREMASNIHMPKLGLPRISLGEAKRAVKQTARSLEVRIRAGRIEKIRKARRTTEGAPATGERLETIPALKGGASVGVGGEGPEVTSRTDARRTSGVSRGEPSRGVSGERRGTGPTASSTETPRPTTEAATEEEYSRLKYDITTRHEIRWLTNDHFSIQENYEVIKKLDQALLELNDDTFSGVLFSPTLDESQFHRPPTGGLDIDFNVSLSAHDLGRYLKSIMPDLKVLKKGVLESQELQADLNYQLYSRGVRIYAFGAPLEQEITLLEKLKEVAERGLPSELEGMEVWIVGYNGSNKESIRMSYAFSSESPETIRTYLQTAAREVKRLREAQP